MIQTFNPLRKSRSLGLLFALILTALSGAFTLSAQLSIAKDGTAESGPNKRITYRLIYQNTGTTIQHNVVISDPLPAFDGNYEGSSPEGVYNPVTGVITWTKDQIPSLAALNAGSGVIYIYGRAGKTISDANHKPGELYLNSSPQTLYNTAYIKSDENPTPVASNQIETVVTQTCTATLSVASGIVKSATNSIVKYVVSITNTGNIWNKWTLSAQNLPGQTLTASFWNLSGQPLNANQTDWVAPGLSTLFILQLESDNGTQPNLPKLDKDPNWTRVTATPLACGSPVSQDFRTDICGGQCDDPKYVTIYKVDTPDPVQSGANLTYQMVLFNPSNVTFPGITLTETYPAGTTYISSTPPLHNGNPLAHTLTGNNLWSFTGLPPGLTTFYITVKVNDNTVNNTIITNKAELRSTAIGATPFDTWNENTTVLSAHNLWVDKTANVTNGDKNDLVTYTITYGNKGNFQGDNVKLIDNYDEMYMDLVDAGGANTTIEPGNLVWEFPGVMPIGFTGTKTYTLRIKNMNFPDGTTNIQNTAIIYNNRFPVIAFDQDYSDNQDTWKVFVANLPDLNVTKTASQSPVSATPAPGTTLTYTLTASNIGDANHTGSYTVADYLPPGVTYISSTPTGPSAGTYDPGAHKITWTLNGALQKNATESFTVTVNGITYNKGGTNLSNKATIYSSGLNDKNLMNNEFTLLTPVWANFWRGNNSTAWNLSANWTYGIPGTGTGNDQIDNNVIFATTGNYTVAAERDLILDQDRLIGKLINNSNQALIIPVNKTLKINETATTGAPERLKLESAVGQANGALIFNNPAANTNVLATVQFASKSKPGTGTWPRVWQFFGVPVKGKTLTDLFGANVQGSIYGGDPTVNAIVRKYQESLNNPQSLQEKWADTSPEDFLSPYLGYEITQPVEGTTYSFKGGLVTDIEYNPIFNISQVGVYARGNYILANPYAAPIFISNLVPSDFGNLAQTIYIYNTGSRQDWKTNNGAGQLGELPGTYTAIPIGTATTLGKTMIPSMQAFMVKAITDSPPTASFKFRYATVNRGTLTYPNEPMRAKRTEATEYEDIKPLLTMDVIGQNSSDRVYLITADGTTKGYDPGWDGYKTLSTDMVQLYALDIDNRRLQVSSDNDLNETYIGFRTGGESTYSLNFKFNSEMVGQYDALYIQDLATGITQEFTDGTTLSFTSAAGTAEKRFKILAPRIITGVNNTTDNEETIQVTANSSAIRVDNNTNGEVMLKVYNLTGQTLLIEKAAVGVQYINHNLTKGTYLIEAKSVHSGSRTTVKAIIH